MNRQLTIRQLILETIARTGGYALPEPPLRTQVDALVRPGITDEEWELARNYLDQQGCIRNIPNPLDEEMKQWAITERGRVLLSQ